MLLDRYLIGWDLIAKTLNLQAQQVYPPYNIRKVDENRYVIEIAVAGFGKRDIEVVLNDNTLSITGTHQPVLTPFEYVYQGIANRAFSRQFALCENVELKTVNLVNGLLKVWLETQLPVEKRTTKIEIEEEELTL